MSNFPLKIYRRTTKCCAHKWYEDNSAIPLTPESEVDTQEYIHIQEHQAIISDLESRLQIVTEALEFYANDKPNTDGDYVHSGFWVGYADDWSDPIGRILKDEGKKAREALQKIKGK